MTLKFKIHTPIIGIIYYFFIILIFNEKFFVNSTPPSLAINWNSNKYCNCIDLSECPAIERIMEDRSSDSLYEDFMSRIICGWGNKLPKVCCPPDNEIPSEIVVNNTCLSPWGEFAQCVDIYDCKGLLEMIFPEPFNSWRTNKQLLNTVRCGPVNGRPKVCCDLKNKHKKYEQPKWLKKYRNFRLLPHELCRPFGRGSAAAGEPNRYDNPEMVQLVYSNEAAQEIDFKCAGTLITGEYVLTAAHCITNLPSGIKLTGVRVRTCGLMLNTRPISNSACLGKYKHFLIRQVIPHEFFIQDTFENDIGLVQIFWDILDYPNKLEPVCLPWIPKTFIDKNFSPEKAKTIGWTRAKINETLEAIELPVLDMELCKEDYDIMIIADKQICVGGTKDVDLCPEDSASPLVAISRYGRRSAIVQFGIFSYGPSSCGKSGAPAVYTKVSYYIDWILGHIDIPFRKGAGF